jgi:hypothetical protein
MIPFDGLLRESAGGFFVVLREFVGGEPFAASPKTTIFAA